MPSKSIYLLVLFIGALCAALVYGMLLKKRGEAPSSILIASVAALILGLAGSRLFYFLARAGFLVPMYGWASLFSFPYNGLALGGAVIGVVLSVWLAEKCLKTKPFALLDPLAPAGMLMVIFARLGEYFVSFGQGAYVEKVCHQFFPLAVINKWEEWYYAIFMLEALIALVILIYSLKMRKTPPGRQLMLTLTLFMLSQVFAESLRAESLKWGFVRVHQLFAVAVSALILLYYIKKAHDQDSPTGQLLLRYVLPFLLGVAALIGLEFAFDKWEEAPNSILYAGMALVLLGMGSLTFRLEKRVGTGTLSKGNVS